MSKVKLKTTGRIGQVLLGEGEYRTVVFPAQGKECSRTKANGVVQTILFSKLEPAE